MTIELKQRERLQRALEQNFSREADLALQQLRDMLTPFGITDAQTVSLLERALAGEYPSSVVEGLDQLSGQSAASKQAIADKLTQLRDADVQGLQMGRDLSETRSRQKQRY